MPAIPSVQNATPENNQMRNIILYRGSEFEKEELSEANQLFECTDRRPDIQEGDLVIGRYSLWPFYADQAKDIEYVGAKLINNYQQHRYISDLQNYVMDLRELTPRTWRDITDLPDKGSFILKGETNSRKSNWKRDMFAPDKKSAIEIYARLMDDSLIGQQNIYIRRYEPMVTYMEGVNGIPITKEFRFFVAYGQILSGGYYWQNYVDELPEVPSPDEVPREFLNDVIERVGNQSNFYTIDVGQSISGKWFVVELNEGQQAGLSCNDPFTMYKNLDKAIRNQK
jgi:hypothetical protein